MFLVQNMLEWQRRDFIDRKTDGQPLTAKSKMT